MSKESYTCECGFACNIWNNNTSDDFICACGKVMKKVEGEPIDLSTDESDKLTEQDKINIKHYGDKGGMPSMEMINYKLNLIMKNLGIDY